MSNIDQYHTLIFDFDGVFTNNKVYLSENGVESVRCCRGDGFAFDLLRQYEQKAALDLDVFILSKEKNKVVQKRAKKLGLRCLNGVNDKLALLKTYFSEHRPDDRAPFDGLIFVGNDLNDLAVMRRAKLSFAPSDAHPIIKQTATQVTAQSGGDGCVRAVVESLLGIDRLSPEAIEEFLS